MYELLVYFPDAAKPARRVQVRSASEVMTTIREALREHEGCERVEVLAVGRRLFTVDCKGNTTTG